VNIEVTFDPFVFSLDAVKEACYRFLDKCSPCIELRDGKIICQLQFDPAVTESSIPAVIANLRIEVLDQELRKKLKAETEPLRNVILAHAFSKTGLIADE